MNLMQKYSTSLMFLSCLVLAGPAAAQPTCQELSDKYAIIAGKGFGFAPADVQATWKKMNCNTRPAPALTESLCQELSNRFGIIAGVTFGSADANAQGSWKAFPCNTRPAAVEQLWLETNTNNPFTSKTVLERGKPYRITMQGTYSMWENFTAPGNRSGKPEPTPMFPSAVGTNKLVGIDPEFYFAWPKGAAFDASPEPAPRRSALIEVSLDGGKTWRHPATTQPFSATEHKYTYTVTGEGNALQVRNNDKPAGDNYGRLQISVQPGA
jgi:hypothetical protein